MPALIGSLFVSLTADFAGFQRNIQSADNSFASSTASIRRNAGLTERSVSSLQRTTSSNIRPGALIAASRAFDNTTQRANLLRGALFATTAAFGGLGAALTSNVISRYLDTFVSLQNQIRAVSADSSDLAGTFSEVQKVADRSRSSLSAVATLYARLARAAPGESQDKLLRRVETINKALQLGGATAQEAASAAIQFSQAIQSNRLGGDELRAVLETPLGGELAKGLGISIGALRKMSIEGKLTSSVVLGALDKISGEVDGRFSKSFSTIDQSLTVVDNKLVAYAGTLNDTYGITRLITGAIGAFGNNLQTIIPLVAQLAASFGIIFAGRLVSGQFTKIVSGIKSVTDARQENLKLARQENDAAQAAVDAAQRRADAARTTSTVAVPKSLTSAVDRETTVAASIEKDRIANLAKEATLRQQLGIVTASTTVAAAKAAQAVTDAEAKVNATIAARGNLYKQSARIGNALTKVQSGLTEAQKRSPAGVADQQELISQRQAVAKQIEVINAQLGKDREALAARVVRAAALETEAERVAAAERIAISKQLSATQAQGALIRSQAQIQAGRIDTAKGALIGAGSAGAAAAVKQTAAELYDAEKGAARAALALQLAGKEAGALSVGFGIARGAVGSFVGFLGGPWGVAITGAIVLLTYFGVRAAASAQQVAEAQQAISDGLAAIGAETDQQQTPDQALALVNSKISAQTAQIEKVTTGLHLAAQSIVDSIDSTVFDDVNHGTKYFQDLEPKLAALQQLFLDGKISVEAFRASLLDLGANKDALDGILASAVEARLQFSNAQVVLNYLARGLKLLDGQRADIEVNLKLNDPAGIFPSDLARGRSRPPGDIQFTPLDTLNQQSAPQDLQPTEFFHNQLIGRANDQGNPALNTAQKIKDRTQAIYEEGTSFGVTMQQAKAFATEELNIAEAQRKASAATKSATKDYEKFADKLRELKETGAAAGLGDIDKQVVDFARSLKDGSKLMAQYIAAVKSGDLSGAPKSLLEARDAFVQIAAAGQANDIVKKYGEGAQVTGMFAQQQEILNAAVASGAITAGQAQLAFADFIGEFGKYDWINKVSDAFGEFADSALTDFDNIGDAFDQLIKSLEKTILQATIIQPFQDWLKGALGQAAGTANSGGGSGDIIGSLFASVAGAGKSKVSSAAAAAMPSSFATFASAGTTKTGIPLAEVTAQGLVAKVDATYASRFQGLFADLDKAGYKISSLGEGGYSYRNVAGTNNLSKHAFGDAVDINPAQNPQAYGATGNFADYGIDPAALAKKNGLKWGGDWNKPDTMHFQVDKSIQKLGDTADNAGKSLSSMNDNVQSVTKSIGQTGTAGGAGGSGGGFLAGLFGTGPQGNNSGMLGNLQVGDHGSALGAGGGGLGGLFTSITQGISGFISGITDAISGIFSSLFGGGGGGGFLTSLLSGIGSIFGFAQGTNSAPKGPVWVGENGPELLTMRGGEQITPMQKLKTTSMASSAAGRMGNGGGSAPLKIIWQDNVGVQRRTERKSGPDGDALMVMIDERVDQGIASGRFDGSYGQRYGANPKVTRR